MSWYRSPLWNLWPDILLPVGMLLSEICGLVSVRRPLWREDGSAICSVITQWSESCRTRNHTLLSHLRLPQSGGAGSRICIPQKQGCPVIHPGTGFPLRRLLRLSGLRLRYSNPPPTWMVQSKAKVKCQSEKWKSRYDRRSVSVSWCPVHSALKGFHPNEFQSDIRSCTLRRNFLLPLGGLHVKHAVQRGICSGTNSAFALGPTLTTENLDRVGRSQDLPDAN
jgi:hypothetical protein